MGLKIVEDEEIYCINKRTEQLPQHEKDRVKRRGGTKQAHHDRARTKERTVFKETTTTKRDLKSLRMMKIATERQQRCIRF